uniref:Uncharacterized protein n=1 Tax=Arundo donax TaxID=35708 RepID=A0A0A9EAK3_ARUDO
MSIPLSPSLMLQGKAKLPNSLLIEHLPSHRRTKFQHFPVPVVNKNLPHPQVKKATLFTMNFHVPFMRICSKMEFRNWMAQR